MDHSTTSSSSDTNDCQPLTNMKQALPVSYHGNNNVKLLQDLPSFPYWPEHLDEVVTMLTDNGIKNIKRCERHETLKGGFSGANLRCKLIFEDSEAQPPLDIVLKGHTDDARSLAQGAYREAIFYHELEPVLRQNFRLPASLLSLADEKTGSFLQVSTFVQDAFEASDLFEHSIYNPTVPYIEDPDFAPVKLLQVVAHAIGQVNAVGYHDESFAHENKSWLRGAAWLVGEDQLGWENKMTEMKNWFNSVRERGLTKQSFAWDCAEASMAKGTWEKYQAMVQADDFHYGLCHGDFHARNMLLGKTDKKVTFIDFEFVGMSGLGMDLGVMLVMALSPEERRKHEHDLVDKYHKSLLQSGAVSKDYTYEMCFADYVRRGASRALTYMVLLANFPNQTFLRYWHDHTEAFLKDHNITQETVQLPEFGWF